MQVEQKNGEMINMAECELSAGCNFLNNQVSDNQGRIDFYKEFYCLGSKSICARYMIAKSIGKDFVPENLSPNHVMRAKEILDKYPASLN